ncbi:MAG: thermonuclease family protein [Nitrospirae bacterium]|nr:MAG: thermonuclease family protein [Nitrospirota bacterium]
MDRSTVAYWIVIAALFGASAFFGLNVEHQRRNIQQASGKFENGDIVRLVKVVDGDTVVVSKDGKENVTVRILGIKSFESKVEHDIVSPYGKAAEDALKRIAEDKPMRVLLNSPPKDKYGRTLATLFAGDQDLGLQLVNQGMVLVYTVYPFPAMQLYLREQEEARSGHRGLWANSEVSGRAEALIKEWQRNIP